MGNTKGAAIARTATNIRAGGKTPISGIIHAVTLLLILMLAGQYAAMVPLSSLAGILLIVCWNMAEVSTFTHLLKGPRQDAVVLCLTFILTVLIDLVVAVEVGVVLAALLFIGRMAQISNVESISRELEGEDPEEQPPYFPSRTVARNSSNRYVVSNGPPRPPGTNATEKAFLSA